MGPVRLDIETEFLIFKIREFRLPHMSSLTGECATQKFKNFCSSNLWTSLDYMVILRSQNKITDFFMILAWANPFKGPHIAKIIF